MSRNAVEKYPLSNRTFAENNPQPFRFRLVYYISYLNPMSSTEVCQVCVITVSGDVKGIQCDGTCERWFHAPCASLSQAEYTKLSKDNSRKWTCGRDNCVNITKQPIHVLITQMSQLSKVIGELVVKVDQLAPLPAKVDQILEQVDSLNRNLASLEQRVHANEAKIASLEKSVRDSARNDMNMESVVSEANERNRRASNIMVYGLPESTSRDTQIRIKYDL